MDGTDGGTEHELRVALEKAEARIKTLEALVQKCKNYDARLCRGPCQGCSEFEKRGRS